MWSVEVSSYFVVVTEAATRDTSTIAYSTDFVRYSQQLQERSGPHVLLGAVLVRSHIARCGLYYGAAVINGEVECHAAPPHLNL